MLKYTSIVLQIPLIIKLRLEEKKSREEKCIKRSIVTSVSLSLVLCVCACVYGCAWCFTEY